MFKRLSTVEEERGKVRQARDKARVELDDTFKHLFAIMDETLAELTGEPPLIEDNTGKARSDGINDSDEH